MSDRGRVGGLVFGLTLRLLSLLMLCDLRVESDIEVWRESWTDGVLGCR